MAEPVSLQSVVCASPDLIFSRVADELVILNLKSGIYHGLEAVGGRAWELMASPVTVAEVRDTLVAEYDVDADRCGRDLLALLEELRSHGLLEVRSPAGDDVSPSGRIGTPPAV